MEGLGLSGGTCSRANRREGHQGDRQKDDGMHLPLLPLPPPPPPPPQVPSTHGPSDRAPRGIGIHHAGAELEPAKGDSGVKR